MKNNLKKMNTEEIKKCELNLLSAFAQFCDKNNLKYYLTYGTLLGAVRHKGFIPWDDDIDVMMPRPDYDKFIELTGFSKINDSYETRLYKNCSHPNIYPYAKLIDNSTIVYEKGKAKKNVSGIWIDIFPLDGYPDWEAADSITALNAKDLFNKYRKLRNMQDLCTTNPLYVNQNIIKKIIKFSLLPFIRLQSVKKLCKKIEDNAQKYNYEKCDAVADLIWGDRWDIRIKKSELEPAELMYFEGLQFKVPHGWDSFLKLLYGNYMQLPPEDQRITHGFNAYKNI